MSKVYVLIVLFLASGWCFTYWHKTALENDFERLATNYEALMGNKMFLEREFEQQNEKILAASERMCEIEKRAEKEKDKGGFDWSNPLPSDSVVKQLHKD